MAVATAVAVTGMVVSAGASIAGMANAKDQERKSQQEQERLNGLLADQRASMQPITNPYKNVSNQYANIGVATKAAKFQAEETDKALANTLDTLRATGASAGGATALAMAALKSKQGISASLEQQEVANEKLRAQGAMEVSKLQAEGEKFAFQAREARSMMDLDRTSALLDQERLNEAAANQAYQTSLGNLGSSALSGTTNILTGMKADGITK